MDFIEFIGFIITFLAMFVLFGKKSKEERQRRTDPAGYERNQRAKKEALEKMYGNVVDLPKPPAPPEEESYEEVIEIPLQHTPPPKPATIPLQINKRIPKKEMVILSTIFGPPKGLFKGRL